MKTPESKTSMDNWEDALAHREDVLLEDIDLLETFGRVERSDGLSKIKLYGMEEEYYLPFESETYTAHATSNVDFDTDI
jgi:oligopeptidase B